MENISGKKLKLIVITLIYCTFFILFFGNFVYAQNPDCLPYNASCKCGAGVNSPKCSTGGPNKANCPVGICREETAAGGSDGICVSAGVCRGKKFDASGDQPGGAADEGLKALKGLLDQVMKALMGGMGMGMGGGGGAPMIPMGGGGGGMPMPSTASGLLDQLNKDKEAENTAGDLLKGLGEDSGISDVLSDIFGTSDDAAPSTAATTAATQIKSTGATPNNTSDTDDGSATVQTDSKTSSGVSVDTSDVSQLSGERGDVRASDNEATFEAGVRDEEKNSEISGFYGFTTRAIGQISVVERLCTSRPWANSFVSRIIPDTFFDGLCIKRGFDVATQQNEEDAGVQAPANITEVENQVRTRIEEREKPNISAGEAGILCEPEVSRPGSDIALSFSCGSAKLTGTAGFTVEDISATSAVVNPIDTAQYAIACSDSKTYSCIVQVFDPRVAIWADPENVPLGTRTKIFWTTEDVDNCTVRGPSFSETGPLGGASTVPINGLSEYKITCIAPDGTEITETTTVDLSI